MLVKNLIDPLIVNLLQPGGKEVRNLSLVTAFRRMGLSEQAGTGIPAIFSNSSRLGRVPPLIDNDKAGKLFTLTLLKELLLSDEQLFFQAGLGVNLTAEESAAFALACRTDRLRLFEVQITIRVSRDKAQAILNRLLVQALLESFEVGNQTYYRVVKRFRTRLRQHFSPDADSPLSDQGSKPLRHLSDVQWQIVEFCDLPHSVTEIKRQLGVKKFSKSTLLDPLIKGGILQLKYPDRPDHRNQRYSLTQSGIRLKANRYKPRPNTDEVER